MPTEWREAFLEELAEEITVGHVGPMATEYLPSGIPFLRSQNVTPLRIDDTDIKFISPAFHARLRKSALAPGDVVIVRTGKPGSCAVIPASLPVANCSDLVIVRCGPELDSRFLAYYINSAAAHHVGSHLVGAVQQHFNVGAARTLLMRLPSIGGQRKIAHVLGTLDDKLELNRRMSETLEAMVRALFKSWFVAFDPVRAKAEGRDTGLSTEVTDLFSDSFEDSEFGEIPRGWQPSTLSAVADLNPESLRQDSLPDRIRYVDLSGVKWGRMEEAADYSSDEAPSRAQRVLRPGDTLVGTVRPGNGSYALVSVEGLIGSTGFAVLRPRIKHWTEFVFLAATSSANIDSLSLLADGGAYPAVRPETVASTRVSCPPPEIAEAFSTRASPLLNRIAVCESECRTLAEIRNRLLPALMSGALEAGNLPTDAGH